MAPAAAARNIAVGLGVAPAGLFVHMVAVISRRAVLAAVWRLRSAAECVARAARRSRHGARGGSGGGGRGKWRRGESVRQDERGRPSRSGGNAVWLGLDPAAAVQGRRRWRRGAGVQRRSGVGAQKAEALAVLEWFGRRRDAAAMKRGATRSLSGWFRQRRGVSSEEPGWLRRGRGRVQSRG